MGRLCVQSLRGVALALIAICLLIAPACGDSGDGSGLSGTLNIDGSSTVFPITQAVVEEFGRENRNVRMAVGLSGTGGGFEKFCNGETEISNASRPISESEEALCQRNGIEYTPFEIAIDGLSVVVNNANDWVECLTMEQLHLLWKPNSPITTWSDLDPSWPDEEISFYSPGTDSGTFDYFTETVNGESGAIRTDISTSEDDNVLITGVAGDENAMGYFGYAYYVENADRMKVVAIDGGNGCVLPNEETIQGGQYVPLSRPLLIYVNNADVSGNEALAALLRFYFTDGPDLIPLIGYVAFPEEVYQAHLATLDELEGGAAATFP